MKIVGNSKTFKNVYDSATFASQADCRVLLTGETGVGKDVFAKLIHRKSKRKSHPFIAVNCASLTHELLQSELFGHVKGAFTGAIKDFKGKIRMANQGTLFLDEIGEMDITLQAKLLKVLEDYIVHPLGSEKNYKVDSRIITATNKDLKKSIAEKKFREDLYFRLDVFNIEIPPLRERIDDIPLLMDHFLEKIISKQGITKKKFDQEAMEVFKKYHWPGNIRELKNIVEKLIIVNRSSEITINDLPNYLKVNKKLKSVDIFGNCPLGQKTQWLEIAREQGITVNDYKEYLIVQELQRSKGVIRKAAAKLKEYNISRQNIRTFLSKET